jgi:energy-coupling factor transporter ATP-binding protein EcfA2
MILTNFSNIRVTQRYHSELQDELKERLDSILSLKHGLSAYKPISFNAIARICFTAGLSIPTERSLKELENAKFHSKGTLHETVFSRNNRSVLWSALLKLRYMSVGIDIENNPSLFRNAVGIEIERGADYLLAEDNLHQWLKTESPGLQARPDSIPELCLHIGSYEDGTEARLDFNNRATPNTQTLIAGATGSGKSNLLAVLLNEIRQRSFESPYPVNFLLFDYKSEFSAPENEAWLAYFEVDKTAILNPVKEPLPINPFEDLTQATETERNLYSNDLANALLAIDRSTISANMNNRLSEAIISAYEKTKGLPVSFNLILDQYREKRPERDREKDDSVTSTLKQLIRSNLFSQADGVNLVRESFIVNMAGFPSDGLPAKAIVYFLVAKLNAIFKKLTAQTKSESRVELRHFTVIDEAHNMLDFDNKPLRKLIAEGRSKGLSVILATQNMASFKSEHFDFYANAYYPLIMKQQTLNDSIIKDLFGVSGRELQEVREAIGSLQLGELILKNHDAALLGIGKRYKKIKVRHLI